MRLHSFDCKRALTLHADEQQVGCQLSPASLGLLLVDPVPVETEEVNNNLFPHCVIQGLLQIDPGNARGKRHATLCFYSLKQVAMQLIFKSAINVSAGYKQLVYEELLLQQTTSHLNHKIQYGTEGSGQ